MPSISVRQAAIEDLATVSSILSEVALWLNERNMTLWEETEIGIEVVRQDIQKGLFYIAFCEDIAAGVVMFQTEDLEFWSDIPQHDSAFLHRLAVGRSFAGGTVSKKIIEWAIQHTRDLGREFLRLDCLADRPSLRSLYEGFGFQYHSHRQVGPHYVARYEYEV